MPKLSELEGVVLGIVGRLSSCTAYAVRKELARSPSTHWSASAGSIYPLVERLEGRGLIKSEVDPADGRGRRTVQLTKRGRAELEGWIMEAVDPAVTARVFDGVRTRTFFLGALPLRERRKVVRGCLVSLERLQETARDDLEERVQKGDRFAVLAARGAVLSIEARIRWMREVADALRT